jgi:anaerobic selenocysteine-containing dehydrogenase
MFSFVRLSDGGPRRYAGPRSEVSVLLEIARRILGDGGRVDWQSLESHAAIRRLIADLIPSLEPLSQIDATKREFHIAGRALHTPRFPTASGKARFHAVSIPRLPTVGENQLRLMTIRSEGQFNTVVYEDEDLYRGQERRDVILMNADDIFRLGLHPDQLVTVRSDVSEMRRQIVRPIGIRPGNAAMYCPEANVLVPAEVDPLSKTPAFKSVLVRICPDR